MALFEDALKKTLLNEGGYVNDPDDPGGETYKGVARKIFSKWDGWQIVDSLKQQSGFPSSLDRNSELQNQIHDFYKVNFWDRISGDDIANQNVAFSIFDFGVNAGVTTSAILAQHVVDANPDGAIGTNTVKAINAMDPEFFLASFTIAKIVRYVGIANKKPASRKYFFGWVSRAVNN
ncbi:MAG TPA: glycosyl hydrolase 108 family protein [Cyclobacteriaceae bacterium]|jgi:lysozyme family protein|nr:glycosyl hydrolase 108 family protein [Cyclobacteriaceae bacterium]